MLPSRFSLRESAVSRKKILLSIALLALLILPACGKRAPAKVRYEGQFLGLFDTVTQIVGYASNKEEFGGYVQKIRDELEAYHKLYDIYNEYEGMNNLKTVNDMAGIAPVKVDRRIIDLLLKAREACELSGGRVNVAMGSVLRIWHEYREAGVSDPERAKLPPMELLREAADHTDISRMLIDEEAGTVFLADPEMSLDVGAIAKGYAVEQAARYIMAEGFTDGMISVGGNIRAFGYKGDNREPWTIGIENPEGGGEFLYTLRLTDRSVVSSGDYMRYYTVDGKRYHHIIDPETLMPAEYFSQVTVICEDSGMGDLLSTALYAMPFEQGLALVESLPGTEAVWVLKGGEVRCSGGFTALLKK